METKVTLNIKGTSEEVKSTVHVDFIETSSYEDRLGFHTTMEVREEESFHVYWVLDLLASGAFGYQYVQPFSCHIDSKTPATTCGRAT